MNRRLMLITTTAVPVPPRPDPWTPKTPDEILADIQDPRGVYRAVDKSWIQESGPLVFSLRLPEGVEMRVGKVRSVVNGRAYGKTERHRRLAGLRSDTIPRVICPA